ncbi:MAG: PorV/PorQ family protein [Candidatus Zixiibacteriota bacterium]
MKNLMLFTILIGIFNLIGADLPDNAGTSSFPFLKNIQSTRSEAMGSAYCGLPAENPYALDNPALLPFANRNAGFSYKNLWGFANGATAYYMQSKEETNGFGFYAHYIGYGKVKETDFEGNVLGELSPSDMVLAGGYGHRFTKSFSVGGIGKLIYENAGDLNASGIALDAGLLYRFIRARAQLGFIVKNLGMQLSAFGDETYPLPMQIGFGGSSRIPGLPLLLSAQGDYLADDGFMIGAGAEILALGPIKPRIGYRMMPKIDSDLAENENKKGLSAGFGIEVDSFKFDYALRHYGVLGLTHNLALEYRF